MTRHIVCICGSGRFWTEILQAAADLTLKGNIVLQPNFNVKETTAVPLSDRDKQRLDRLHLEKISMAHEVFVVNKDGYIGESTAREIEHALTIGRRVTFLDAETGNAWVEAHVDTSTQPPTLRETRNTVMAPRATSPIVQAAGKLHAERRLLINAIADLRDLAESAWGVIANVNSGAWHLNGSDWKEAAERWRDRFLAPTDASVMALIEPTLRSRKIIETVHLLSREAKKGASVETLIGSLRELAGLVGQWADPVETGS